MSLSIAIQMDPVETLQIAGDTTFALGLEAQKRGHSLWYYTADKLSLNEGSITARGQDVVFMIRLARILKPAQSKHGHCRNLTLF